jgi:hypothetical protein
MGKMEKTARSSDAGTPKLSKACHQLNRNINDEISQI